MSGTFTLDARVRDDVIVLPRNEVTDKSQYWENGSEEYISTSYINVTNLPKSRRDNRVIVYVDLEGKIYQVEFPHTGDMFELKLKDEYYKIYDLYLIEGEEDW